MLVNLHHGSTAEHNRLLAAGVAFLVLVGSLVGLSIAIYAKVFEPVTMVTVKAERAGLQLPRFGDVRLNGVLVGQVREVAQDGREASIKLGLRPEAAEEIPGDVGVEILPTTLFGQKYVSLVPTASPAGRSLRDGDVIPSDRVDTNVELSAILADLFPLLRSVEPADLNATLNALATALGGRGERLGQTLVDLDDYLGAIADDLPTLRQDLALLADVARTYDGAAGDLLQVLDDVTVTAQTVVESEEELGTFFADVAGLGNTTRRILADNEADLVRIGEVTAPVMEVLAAYAPQYPCLLRGLDRYEPLLAKTFQDNRIRQYVELITPQNRPYTEEDAPTYGEVGTGPRCRGLPNPPVPSPGYSLDQGSAKDENPTSNVVPLLPVSGGNHTSGLAGTEGERQVVNTLLSARSGRSADRYASMPAMFYAPMLRGEDSIG